MNRTAPTLCAKMRNYSPLQTSTSVYVSCFIRNAGIAKNATTYYDTYIYSVFLPIRKVAAAVTAKCQYCDGASLCADSSRPNLLLSVKLNISNSLFTYYAFFKTFSTAYCSAGNKHKNVPAKERGLFFCFMTFFFNSTIIFSIQCYYI